MQKSILASSELIGRSLESISGLRRALKRMGEWDNTLIMTYSEFGRRAYENESDGTDHGTAAPHFLCGRSVAMRIWRPS